MEGEMQLSKSCENTNTDKGILSKLIGEKIGGGGPYGGGSVISGMPA
jgi:hypothetical protein